MEVTDFEIYNSEFSMQHTIEILDVIREKLKDNRDNS